MAETKKDNFPSMSEANWWALRKRFIRTLPTGGVTSEYVSSVLGNMTPESARANVIRPLKAVGLIDEQNKPTDLASRWRHDEEYQAVCEEIRNTVYPQGLLDAFPDADADPVAVQNWFARNSGVGIDAARKMARFYLLLTDANPKKNTEAATSSRTSGSKVANSRKGSTSKPVKRVTEQAAGVGSLGGDTDSARNLASSAGNNELSLHIDVQIHISPEASLDQIDQIFASMARHLSFRKQGDE